jgi:hypothetical protein
MMKKTLIAAAVLTGLSTYGMRPASAANTVNVIWGAGAEAEAYLNLNSPGGGAIELYTGKGAGTMGEISIALDAWRLALLRNPSVQAPGCIFGGGMGWDRTSVQWPSPSTFQEAAVGQAIVYFTWATNQSTPLADNSEYWIEFHCWQS